MAQRSRRGEVLAVAALLAAVAIACQDNALRPPGGTGGSGWSGRPGPRDAGTGDVGKAAGDASPDTRLIDATPAPLGVACPSAAGCLSGFCIEGICCATACAGGCQTCAAPGAVGTCVARAAGAAPRLPADCPLENPASCGLDGTCDGAGACRLYDLGNVCVPGVCANGVVTGAYVCDGQGTCRPGAMTVCAPYGCDPATNQCKASCQSDSDCLDGRPCHNGACGDPYRDPCLTNEECASGFCTDGVCCNTACAGPCLSCAVAGHLGTCTPVAAGTADPHAACVDQGPTNCGHDGTCDGQGACSLYPAGVTCAATSSCSGTLWSGTGTCDGAGTCQRETRPCLPYACDPLSNACHNACATADDCAPGKPCVDGTCGILEPAACSADAECATGFCAQGACCTTKCAGPCFSCALPGTIGTCMPVSNPLPPDAGVCAS